MIRDCARQECEGLQFRHADNAREVEHHVLLALDCYAELRPPNSATYIGNERFGAAGIAPVWPDSAATGRKKIAAYLKADYRPLESVLRALDAQYATVPYVTQLDESKRQRLQTDHLRLSPAPLDMMQLTQECDALICHAGAGTAPLFLEAGKPVVLLPQQAEQRVNADRIEAMGVGVSIDR
jgi:UDP-N-acetylglucosamine:LPS N-acetylglucosamine transferase